MPWNDFRPVAAHFAEEWLSKSPEGCAGYDKKTIADVCWKAEKYCPLSSLVNEFLKAPEHWQNTVQNTYACSKGKTVHVAIGRSGGGDEVNKQICYH